MIGPDELPATMVTGRPSACGCPHASLGEGPRLADFAGWEARRSQRAKARGRVSGWGSPPTSRQHPDPSFFNFVMPGMGTMFGAEPARMVLEADGMVTVPPAGAPRPGSRDHLWRRSPPTNSASR